VIDRRLAKIANMAKDVAIALDEISQINPQVGGTTKRLAPTQMTIVTALDQFQDNIRYLNTRRSKGAVIDINGEDDVQDVVFLMLRPWIPDLIPENPTNRMASRFVIKDFLSKELKTVVEAKFVRDKKHGKETVSYTHLTLPTICSV